MIALKCNFVFSLWNMTKHIYQTLIRKAQIPSEEKMALPFEFTIECWVSFLPLLDAAAEKVKRLLLYGGRPRGDTPL